jgi:zinc/manganese transport system permease protein
MSILQLLLPAFVASLILTGIHAYLGVHVVERGVIFVDLSLAQIAALGTTVAYLMGYDLHSTAAYLFSLGFTFLGAAIFAFTRVHHRTRIPQEAIIGIVYAVSAAVAILVMSKATQETEHLKDMLVGNILSVTWTELAKTAVLYSLVGAFHYVFRERFLLLSMNEREAVRRGISVRLWDFLFYISFGFVVTSSVAIAGVLLVFCFLIVPSVAAMLFSEKLGTRLAIGWSLGALVSAGGVALSFYIDLPTGATIVATFGLALLLLGLVRKLFFRSARAQQPAHREGLAADLPAMIRREAVGAEAPAVRRGD